jgi:hypothetical protein
MWLTGYTSNRLNEVKTLDFKNPFKVGVKGVFNIQPNFIEYEIDGILYKTYTNRDGINNFINSRNNVDVKNLFNLKTYSSPIDDINTSLQDTIFKYKPSINNFEYKNYIKEEKKIEQVFLPKIQEDIFIERTHSNVYEKHMRLMDIKSIGQLENYKNGFFNIKRF